MTNSFFRGKRPWSKIKDQILGSYMVPYLSKVSKLNKPILIIDAFAGPGKFIDGTVGSPLIICQMAERHAKSQYLAVFVNKNVEEHNSLKETLQGFIEKDKAIVMLGTAEELLGEIHQSLEDDTLFLYLDPFGLKGCEFGLLEPYFRRNKLFSTEIIINMSVPAIHRLATRKAIRDGRENEPIIKSMNKRLSLVLGGDYWKKIMWGTELDNRARIETVVLKYLEKIQRLGLEYTGSCPVMERPGAGIKYYIAFCSRHPHAMLLMNDLMKDAYQDRMHAVLYADSLFEKKRDKYPLVTDKLKNCICQIAGAYPRATRVEIWQKIVQGRFMGYHSRDYRKSVNELVFTDKVIEFEDVRGTRRLNDDSRLLIK